MTLYKIVNEIRKRHARGYELSSQEAQKLILGFIQQIGGGNMQGDGWHLLAERYPRKLEDVVNKYLAMGFELCGNAFAVYGEFGDADGGKIWHYQAMRRGKPTAEEAGL
jgi:hypothetical protein